MKRKQLLLSIFALFITLSVQAGSGIFLRGDINSWGATSEWEFADEGNGVYTLYDKELSGRFKIADENWSTYNFGAVSSDATLVIGVPLPLVYDGTDINCGAPLTCQKITFTVHNDATYTLLIEGTSGAPTSGIFLRGGLTNWDTLADWEFIDEGNGVYALYDKELYGQFKIASADWSTVNYGSPAGTFTLGEPFALSYAGNDISCTDTYICSKITFTLIDGNATLLVEGNVKPAGELTEVYVIGDNNNWNFNDASGKLSVTGDDGIYEGSVTIYNAGTEGIGYWRIYEGLGQVGCWGNPGGNNTTTHTTSGTLERESQGCITTNANTYIITFNRNTGQFSAVVDDGTGIISQKDDFEYTLIDGKLNINSPADISVYKVDGTWLLSDKNINNVDLSVFGKGVYIIKVSTTAKTHIFKMGI